MTFWQPELTSRFLQLVRRYRPSIRVAFAGHTHMDDFRVIRPDGEPALLCKVAPAISPIFGNNPGYQVYRYDRGTGALQGYRTYFLTDLADGGGPRPPTPGRWALEYDFGEAYGLDALTPAPSPDWRTDGDGRRGPAALHEVLRRRARPPRSRPGRSTIYRCAISNRQPRRIPEVPGRRAEAARRRPRPAADGGPGRTSLS